MKLNMFLSQVILDSCSTVSSHIKDIFLADFYSYSFSEYEIICR